MAKEYNFQYTPLTGRLPGNSFVKQTEQAINELAGIVNEGSAQVEVLTNLANTANDNAEEALDKATEALDTASRIYITLPNAEDADDYFESQLYYFADSSSDNLPVEDTGFLEVKTNDTKTACEQVFIADLTGLCYFRHGTITSAEVGSETVYTVTWSTWSSELASEDYVQGELLNYLPLSGGTISGTITYSAGTIAKRNVDTSYLQILGGNSDSSGANLVLYGENADVGGHFELRARNSNGFSSSSLLGKTDGTLTWGGNNVITSTNVVSTNSSSASGEYYSYPVPTGKVFANFKTLGGKTIAWNQLLQNGNFANGLTGWYYSASTTVSVSDGAATVLNAIQNGAIYTYPSIDFIGGHKYFFHATVKTTGGSNIKLVSNDNYATIASATNSTEFQDLIGIKSYSNSGHYTFSILDGRASDWDNLYVKNCYVIDLTLLYGAGNEPSTVEEFEAMFPASYYAYNAGTLLSAGIKEVIAKDSSNNVVATMPIPSAVQSLEGYGWSAGTAYNYVDFERKVFVKNVGKVVIDSSYTPTYVAVYSDTDNNAYCYTVATNVFPSNRPAVTQYFVQDFSLHNNKEPYTFNVSTYGFYCITNHATLEAFTAWLSTHPITVYYELATPVETDISSILGATGIACGNTLTFDYNTNYRLPVPVSMDMLDGTNGLMTAQDKAKLDVAYQGTNQEYPYLPLSGGTLTGEANGVTPTAGDNSTKLATTAFVKTAVDVVLPTGVVQAFAGTTIPNGWLLCDGSAVSRTTYANLFACIGTTYGAGDGTDTFNVPNLVDKFIQGNAVAGTEHSAGLPNISGYITSAATDASGAFALPSSTVYREWNVESSGPKYGKIDFDASRSSSIYGNSTTVQPPALTMRYIIKY